MNEIKGQTKCENCGKGTMKPFGEDSFYIYSKCNKKQCRKERLTLKTDMVQAGSDGKDEVTA